MSQAGLGTPVIVAKIETSETSFDTGVDALVALAEKGVHSDVLKAMVDASGRGSTAVPEGAVRTDSPRPTEEAPAEVPRAEPPTRPGSTFRERLRSGGEGPLMVVIPAGRFRMGCLSGRCRRRFRRGADPLLPGLGETCPVHHYGAGVCGVGLRGDVRGLRPIHGSEQG